MVINYIYTNYYSTLLLFFVIIVIIIIEYKRGD